jgi:hypothetical protein
LIVGPGVDTVDPVQRDPMADGLLVDAAGLATLVRAAAG